MFLKAPVILAALALIVGIAARPSGGAGRARVYVVKPTDTLWTIAAANYAGDPREGVWELEHRNHLAGTTVVPGQRLVIP
jgi:LysM repeat protein